jgi:superoxide reductase
MKKLGDYFQQADWKKEKHVPVIECPDQVKAGEVLKVEVSVGKKIPHPNTTEHHIRWIKIFFQPDGGKFMYHVASLEFSAHGESTEGPDTGPVYTDPHGVVSLKIEQPGVIYAASFCNIHGLWESFKQIEIA